MRLLLDTHILLWCAAKPEELSAAAVAMIQDPSHELVFSAVSIWEVAIKTGRGRADFQVDPNELRRNLLLQNWTELPITGDHAAAVLRLPKAKDSHGDPFDRMLIAQATVEEMLLLTRDEAVAQYPGPIRRV